MSAPAVILVGGSQRSGTHALAALIAAHPAVGAVPRELVFHAVADGLPGLLAGTRSAAEIAADLRGRWWCRRPPWDHTVTRGLHKSMSRERLEAALDTFTAEVAADPAAAAGRLLRALADPFATAAGGRAWVEMTPANASAAPALRRMLGPLRLVHVVRDGRDVACSLVSLPWGPQTLSEGLDRWEQMVRAADAGAAGLPANEVFTLQLEELLTRDRTGALTRLMTFLGLEITPELQAFFDAEFTPANGHVGRWRAELAPDVAAELSEDYLRRLTRMQADGVRCVPATSAPWDALPAHGPDAGRSTVDPWADGRAEDA